MGIDLLDITFRIERRSGIRIDVDEVKSRFVQRTPIDLSVGELHEVLLQSPRFCKTCRRDLPGPTRDCPGCGGVLDPVDPEKIYADLVASISVALGVPKRRIERDSLQIRDLGLS